MTFLRSALLALALAAGAPASAADEGEGTVLVVATGDVTGAYFPVGVALCRVVNESRRVHGLRCSATPTAGSTANLTALRAGEVQLAIAQSDAGVAAVAGAGSFAGASAFTGLRTIAALYPEPLTLVARAGSGIEGIADLAGKRVGVGPEGGGQRALVDALRARLGWQDGAFEADPLGTAAAVNALCEDRLDAILLTVGHPALAVREAVDGCGATLTPLKGPEVDAVVAVDPALVAATIPAGLYRGVDAEVPTFGVEAVLFVRADVPEAEVETVTGALLDNLAALAGFEPTLAALDPAEMPRGGRVAPLHPGAEAAYRARGLLE